MFKTEKSSRKADIVFGAILVLVSSFFLFESIKILNNSDQLRTTSAREAFLTSPGIMPLFISSMLIMMGLILIITGIRKVGKISKEDLFVFQNWFKSVETKRSFVMFAILLVYIFGFLGKVSYEIATFIFLTAFMLYVKASKWYYVLIIAAITTVSIAYAFGDLAMIPLP